MSAAEGKSALVLEEEIASLLRKRAIRVVPPEDSHQGFYSRYFVIPKRGGGLRPILDLRILNKHLRKYKFKMPTFKTPSHFIHEKDWFTLVDLEDVNFHIGIYPAHRKFLRFAYQGTAYEFMTVPFWLSLAPRTFCRCIEAALSLLRTAGLRVSAYLDNLLLCSPSRQQAETDTKMLVSHLERLGFKINETKSCLVPTQEIVYLGLRLNSDQYQAFLSEERIRSIRSCLSLFQKGRKVPFRLCLRLLGLMASTVSVIPLGLLRMREFQNWTAALHLCPKRHLNRKVMVSALCMRTLRYWKNCSFLESGTPLGAVSMRKVVTTDASLSARDGAKRTALRISSVNPDHTNSEKGKRVWPLSHTDCPKLAGESVAGGDNAAFSRPAMASPATQRSSLAGAQGRYSTPPRTGLLFGLGPVIKTTQNAGAASTRSAYDKKWNVFEQWCVHKRIVPFLCSVADVLCFLQELLDKGRAFSTIKVYLAAISACHVGIDDNTMGRHPLVCRFMRGAQRLNRVSRPLIPLWDLSVVINAHLVHLLSL
ncbi:hypothetical protein M9458_053132 [Cirrhinus mrigala]|uniref:ribonuclease H n=1 Tax=Cirrhinus mrigala TaxID=683832 RepID=A0ABD0MN70_CIRMR